MVKTRKAKNLGCQIDFVEAHTQLIALYNSMLNLYMLQRVSAKGDVSPKVQVALLQLRTLLTRLSFIQSKLEGKIENVLRAENTRVG